jgi:response regulator RpfG family c-di-GMP phosphodiesterase
MELLRRVKENSGYKKIPVILCTAMADAEHVRRACALGCRHYLVKPIQRATLLQKVAEALGEKPQTLLDKELIKSKFGVDEETYTKFAAAILQFLEEQRGLLERKINHPSSTPVIIDLPQLSENASTLGAERLSKLLDRLQAEKNRSVLMNEEYRPLLAEIEAVIQALRLQSGAGPSSIPAAAPEGTPLPPT